MPRRNDISILEILLLFPWWVSAIASAVVYIALAFIAPSLDVENQIIGMFLTALSNYAWFFSLCLLIPALISYLKQKQKRQRLDFQKSIGTIRDLSWREFEELVGEAYRRRGYSVLENPTAGADGGIDIRLRKDGALHLVQCKQWRSNKVGVSIVREMFGILTAEHAASMTIVTSGMFTQAAKNFAHHKAIDLIDGAQLLQMVSQVQSAPRKPHERVILPKEALQLTQLDCPKCGSELVLRTAKKGINKGNRFYGCSAFPKCRHTQPSNS
ncbi:MAG: restriction endonuclease [Cyanobacteria bacterium P01_E01_bin.34]